MADLRLTLFNSKKAVLCDVENIEQVRQKEGMDK